MEEQKEDGAKVLQFTDAKGRVWSPRIDCRVVDAFERHIGVGVFEAVFDSMLSTQNIESAREGRDPNAAIGTAAVLSMSKALFGKIGSLSFLLYEACRPGSDPSLMPSACFGDPDAAPEGEHGEAVAFADFRAAIGKEELESAMTVALHALLDFFPKMDGAAKGGDGNGPFGDWVGKMFMNVRP